MRTLLIAIPKEIMRTMDKKILFLLVTGTLVLMLLIAALTAYVIKFNRMKQDWTTEKTKRENLEIKVNNLERELSVTKDELSAQRDAANLYQEALESVKSETSVLKDKFTKIEEEKMRIEAERKRKEAEFAELQASFRDQIEAQEMTITELKGKLTVNLVDKILFDSGKANLKRNGKKVLDKIANVLLNKYPDRQIRVEGHTDDLPIGGKLKKQFPTNWELSAARALSAVRYLQETNRVDPKRLAAVAFGQHHPIEEGKTLRARARNRRIEIVLLPPEPEIRAGTSSGL